MSLMGEKFKGSDWMEMEDPEVVCDLWDGS